MNRRSRHTFIAGMLALTMLVGASLACNRGNRQNNTAPATDQPAVQAPATQPQTQPTDQPSSAPATQEQPAATAQSTEAPPPVPPTATQDTSASDALGAQVDDLLNQLDAANKSADDLGDANP